MSPVEGQSVARLRDIDANDPFRTPCSCSPPVLQKRRDGKDDRSDAEKAYFKGQLEYIPTVILKSQILVLWRRATLTAHGAWSS